MADKLIEVVYGKRNKFEIFRREGGVFSSTEFRVYKDGEYVSKHGTLQDAVRSVAGK